MFAIYSHFIHAVDDPVARDVSRPRAIELLATGLRFHNPIPGTVYGALLNDRDALAALGEAVNLPPYNAPPKAPILYIKPRNTLSGHGSTVEIPAEAGVQVGGSLGIVIGKTACAVEAKDAMAYVAGYTIVADLCIPHESVYRPSVRYCARDGFCVAGPAIVARDLIDDPNSLKIDVSVSDLANTSSNTSSSVRSVEQLIADVTDFMTLSPGDVLTMGVPFGSPTVTEKSDVTVSITGLPPLRFSLNRPVSKENAR